MASIVCLLKASPKGQLKYESDPNIEKEYFDKYLSPPKLSRPHQEVSSENSFCYHDEDERYSEDTSESDISESIRNLRVEVTCRNDKRKTQKKVQFTTRNNSLVHDMRIQVDKEKAGFPDPHNKNGHDRNLKISFNGSGGEANFKKNGCGMLIEKPLDRPSLSKEQTRKIVVSPEYNKSRRDIQFYEEELNSKAKMKLEQKRDQFKKAERRINERAEQRINEFENSRLEKARNQQLMLEQEERERSAKLIEKQKKIIKDHIEYAKMVEQKKERIQEEIKKKEEEKLMIWDKTKTIVSECKTILDRIKTLYTSYAAKLPENVAKAVHNGQQRYHMSQQIVAVEDRVPDISNKQLVTITENFRLLSNTLDFVQQAIQEVKEREKREAEAKAEEEAKKKAEEEAARRVQPPPAVEHPGQPLVSSTPIPGATGSGPQGVPPGATASPTAPTSVAQVRPEEGEVLCVDVVAFQEYTQLQQKLKDMETAIQVLSSTSQLKKLKFDLQKAVNIPVNAISAVSGAHLRDKLQRLLVLLSGQQVEIANKRVSVNEHPAALTFCKHLIAKMVVKKGEEQVSSIFESAFPLAAVTVGILAEHPDIKDLLLAHFQLMCPYTVPYHIPRQEGQSTKDVHIVRGYKYDSDGNVEKQDKFLKRMSGIMRLYASLMVSYPPRRQSEHPFGIENAWLWLSRVMNIQPLPDITATMVFDLLEVTGHALYKEYRKQFLKMLHILIREFLPKLKSVASSGGGGPVSRLEALIMASIQRQGQIPPPEGILSPNFWFS
ncbi:mRNA export factor GLE1-like [Crassostrea angulata]|uniref:mRNA export factor GLE1-like n=1 Tax=Magallana angulata TaxID=2784310 RepID=UPI0022B20D60|nr:mRNA export factor GLE1-like [Crassostrea angulata]